MTRDDKFAIQLVRVKIVYRAFDCYLWTATARFVIGQLLHYLQSHAAACTRWAHLLSCHDKGKQWARRGRLLQSNDAFEQHRRWRHRRCVANLQRCKYRGRGSEEGRGAEEQRRTRRKKVACVIRAEENERNFWPPVQIAPGEMTGGTPRCVAKGVRVIVLRLQSDAFANSYVTHLAPCAQVSARVRFGGSIDRSIHPGLPL